jgi:drug/metabolite transporter (DMT)-like permease
MSWQLLVGISVLLFSTNSLLHRVLMRNVKSDPYAQTVAFYGLGGLLAFLIALARGGFQYRISPGQIPYFIILAIFCTLAPLLAFKAYKEVTASEATILFSSQRWWMVLAAFLVLQEPFSLRKVIGTLIILLGIAIAVWRKQKYVFNRGVIYALLAAFCYAVADIVAFFILRHFDAPSLSVYISLIPVVAIVLIKPATIKKLAYYCRPKYALAILAVSFNDTLASLAVYYAYQIGRNAAQISPLMATQIILSVLLAIIFLKERDYTWRKIIGALVVVGGVWLVM